jgi:hypothetical protein
LEDSVRRQFESRLMTQKNNSRSKNLENKISKKTLVAEEENVENKKFTKLCEKNSEKAKREKPLTKVHNRNDQQYQQPDNIVLLSF